MNKCLALHVKTAQLANFADLSFIVVASSARRGKAAVGTAATPATTATASAATAAAAAATAGAAAAASGGDMGETSAMGVAGGASALSVADRVVTEYEKLLQAIPTMARHMGKLQGDTETMAEGK